MPPELPVEVILKPNKLALENTAGLQILVEFISSKDIANYNTTQNDNLPAEIIEKTVEEEYSVKLMAYTNDYGQNLAIQTSHWVSSIFNSQQAKNLFLKNKMRVSYYTGITSVETALDYENLTIMQFKVKVIRLTIFNTQADYYDTLDAPISIFDK